MTQKRNQLSILKKTKRNGKHCKVQLKLKILVELRIGEATMKMRFQGLGRHGDLLQNSVAIGLSLEAIDTRQIVGIKFTIASSKT